MAEEPTDTLLAEIERTAVDIARLAGSEIQSALGRELTVRYKGDVADGGALYRDPVSEVDHNCEVLIRARLGERFPEHGIIGEELDAAPGDDFVWAIDPIDGTTNFVNGFPLFAAAIGVLHRGRPVVGAIWCSTTHALRDGIYHARRGGKLAFEGEPLKRVANPAVRRRLAGEPDAPSDREHGWDIRKTGSAAIECAFVAAGLLDVARFARPNVWDVAGGIALVEASGRTARVEGPDGWVPFEGFDGGGGFGDIKGWRHGLVVGEAEAAARMAASASGP